MKKSFDATIEAGDGGGAFVPIPFDVEKTFGSKRPRVKATVDGHPYRGSLVRMGSECHLLLILKAIRASIGKNVGDKVRVTVEEDLEPRVVEVPEILQRAFARSKSAKTAFDALSYTHQREYVTWISKTKREETRASRIEECIAELESGQKPR